jgi:hypothetical protein
MPAPAVLLAQLAARPPQHRASADAASSEYRRLSEYGRNSYGGGGYNQNNRRHRCHRRRHRHRRFRRRHGRPVPESSYAPK